MNFGTVLALVTDFLNEQGYRHALIGGIALAAYGLPRTTIDADLIVTMPGVDRREIQDYFERQGFKDRYDELERTL